MVATSKMAELDDCSISLQFKAPYQLKFEALSQLIKEEGASPTDNIRAHTNKAVYQQSQLCRAKVSWESRLVSVTELAS